MTDHSLLDRLAAEPERLPGSLLLSGSDAGHLEERAHQLAARLLCPGNDPRMVCASCRRVFEGLHPDLFRVQPEGVQIRIDRIRDALAFGAGRPYEASRRVAIVSRAELLGAEASNALLKSLEEPGQALRWIVTTTRPETLLPTILSRCAAVRVAPASSRERRAAWSERGFSAEDAEDLVLLGPEVDAAPQALASFRQVRSDMVQALETGLVGRRLVILLLLADRAGRSDQEGRLLAELLADAAMSNATTAEALRHRAVAGITRGIGQRLPGESLRRAATLASDPPADVRRGNRRLHFERVLLELYLGSN